MDRLDRIDLAIAPDRLGMADFSNRALDMVVTAFVRLNSTDLAVAALYLFYRAIRPFGLVRSRNRLVDDYRPQWAER